MWVEAKIIWAFEAFLGHSCKIETRNRKINIRFFFSFEEVNYLKIVFIDRSLSKPPNKEMFEPIYLLNRLEILKSYE